MVNKHRAKTMFIPRNGSTATTSGTLYNGTTGTPNLAIGSLAFYGVTDTTGNHTALGTGATTATAPFWKMILRRDESNDTTPLPQRRYIETNVIDASCKVSVKKNNARIANNNAWLVGAPLGTAGEVPVFEETEYIINCSARGWNVDLYNGRNQPLKMGRFTTPEYSVSTRVTTNAQQVDDILCNIAYDFNSQSWTEAIAICLDSTAASTGTGVQTLNTVIGLPVGSLITIGFTDDGQAITLELDRDLIETFRDFVTANTAGTWELVPYARYTSQNINDGNHVAGGTAAAAPGYTVDQLMMLALDLKPATYQEVPQEKTTLVVGLDGGFDGTTSAVNSVSPSEGSGSGKEVLQMYQDYQSHKMYPGNKPWQPYHVEYPSEILPNAYYDIYTFEFCKTPLASTGAPSISPQVVTIAIVNTTAGNAVTNPYYTGVANPMNTYLTAFFNSWVGSTGYPHTTLV